MALTLAIIISIFLALIALSMFTDVKNPIVDKPIASIISKYTIKKKRAKNNLIFKYWDLKYFDIDIQDFRWEYRENNKLVAKLRIKYYPTKKIFIAYHYRFISSDVIDETTVYGEPDYLMKLFGIPKRSYQIIDVRKKPKCKKIFGNIDHKSIMMNSTLRHL
jgi:hypothetical protein